MQPETWESLKAVGREGQETAATGYAETLSEADSRRYRLYATLGALFGCFAEVMLDSTAIVIVYLTMLGGSNTLTMLATSLTAAAGLVLSIPLSGVLDRIGVKRMVPLSCLMAVLANALMAAAPWAGAARASYVALAGCFLFCVSRPLWSVSWYPLLGMILKPSQRADFFGQMRFTYYVATGITFALVGRWMGRQPALWMMQTVIAAVGVLALTRWWFIARIRLPKHVPQKYDLKRALHISVTNSSLVGFSVYYCVLNLAFTAVLPMALLYLKRGLDCPANIVQYISIVGMAGSILSYLTYGWCTRHIGMRWLQLLIHAMFIAVPLGLFCCGKGVPGVYWWIGALLFLGYFANSSFGCVFGQETLALARPGNATMATALTQTYQCFGASSGRIGAAMLLNQGILCASWQCGSIVCSNFQTIFLICGLLAIFSLALVFLIPSLVPRHEDYYRP